jgi:Gpi18-like mannosyltransferase
VQQSPTLEGDFLKLSSLFFMWGTFYILFLFYKQVRKSTGYEFLFLTFFNPFFYYSTALWGQVDIVPLFFLLSALYIYFYQKKYLLFILPLVTVGLLCKQTIIIFLPLLGYLLLKKDKVNFAKGSLLSLVIFILSFIPFAIQSKNLFFYGFATYFQKVVFSSSTQYVTSYAFNLWTLLTNVYNVVDSQKFLFLSFRTLGIIIFSLFYLQAFWVLKQKQNLQHVLYAFFLVGASAFFFLTRMHERHLFQALPFLLILGFRNSKAKKLFIVLSFLHFLNLYYVWNPWRQIFDLGAAPLIVPKLLSFLGLVTLVVFLVQRKCLLSLKSKNDEK